MVKLASLKLMLSLFIEEEISWDHIATTMSRVGIAVLTTLAPKNLANTTTRNASNAMKNTNDTQDNLMEHFGGYFRLVDNKFLS